MNERRKQRRHEPDKFWLRESIKEQKRLSEALEYHTTMRDKAFLNAAQGGWSMREIADSVGISASTVCRIINAAEEK